MVDPARPLPRPFEGRYGVSLAIAIVALVPYIVVTAAYALYRDQLAGDLGAGPTSLEIASGLSTAGYAFGALLAGDMMQRFGQRPLFLLCEGLFVAGCFAAASAGGLLSYGAGRVAFGFATGMLLIVALPPVIQRFPANRLPITAGFVDIGFFGAVTIGPIVGGLVAYGHAWRWFYGGLGGLGMLVFGFALLTLPDQEPPNPDLPFDISAIGLALLATVLPFWAAGELGPHGFQSVLVLTPLIAGLASFAALIVTEYRKREPLSPVKEMWHTLPLAGTLVAMAAGGVFVTLMLLAVQFLVQVAHREPLSAGLIFWPQVLGAVVAAALLGMLLRTRFLPLLVAGGMLALIGDGFLLLGPPPPEPAARLLAAFGLLGFGAGATVASGLWLASFALPSKMVGRTFALVEWYARRPISSWPRSCSKSPGRSRGTAGSAPPGSAKRSG